MLLNSHISPYARCLAGKGCGLVRSTWGTSQGEDKLGARDKILNTKVARRACAGRATGKQSPRGHGGGGDRCCAQTPVGRRATAPLLRWAEARADRAKAQGSKAFRWATLRRFKTRGRAAAERCCALCCLG